MTKKIYALLVFGLISGCASTEANLQRESARVIGHGLSPEQVLVSNVDRGMTNVNWIAKTPRGKFNCSADDMVRRVTCVK